MGLWTRRSSEETLNEGQVSVTGLGNCSGHLLSPVKYLGKTPWLAGLDAVLSLWIGKD